MPFGSALSNPAWPCSSFCPRETVVLDPPELSPRAVSELVLRGNIYGRTAAVDFTYPSQPFQTLFTGTGPAGHPLYRRFLPSAPGSSLRRFPVAERPLRLIRSPRRPAAPKIWSRSQPDYMQVTVAASVKLCRTKYLSQRNRVPAAVPLGEK